MLIVNADILTPAGRLSPGWMLTEGGKITAVGEGTPPTHPNKLDAGGLTLLPGLIDIHIHGSGGFDVMDATPEALIGMGQFLARHGVTGFLATTLSDSHERLMAALHNVRAHMGRLPEGAQLLGAHLEGPYLNPAKCGAQNPQHVRPADMNEARQYLETGVLRLISLAPEYPDNLRLTREAVGRGVVVSAAHTEADYEAMLTARAAGLSHLTHTFNAMPGLHHRQPGLLGVALTDSDITCELIADNIHVHPAMIALLWRLKRPDGLILISDAMRAAGLPDGAYDFDGRPVEVRGGAVRLPDGTLAGSTLTLNRALANLCAATREDLSAVWETASANPARLLGLNKGVLAPGYDADWVLLDAGFDIHMTAVAGEIVYRKG